MVTPSLSLEKFDCEGDTSSVCIRWERWKRSLNIYMEAAGVKTAVKKRASLLHWGGTELQEIFFNIPGADVTPEDSEEDVFQWAIKKLDSYFAPKQNKRFERHIFRKIKQEENEKFEKFLVRLRQQATKCQFDNVEDHLIDQITERCASEELRKKILKAGDNMTIENIISEANALEAISRQLEGYKSKDKEVSIEVNKVDEKTKAKECFRCGSWGHFSSNENCPARGKKCLKCGKIGHFRLQCKSQVLKRKYEDTRNEKEKDKENKQNKFPKKFRKSSNVHEVRNIEEEEVHEKGQVDYLFNINGDDTVECRVGGTVINMIIDSGCKHNLITDKTWEKMKKMEVKVTDEVKEPKKTFLAYGSETPLRLLGSFRSNIQFAGKSEDAIFYVVDKGTRNLLGKATAMAMGVLRIGLEVNQVDAKPFPKLKDIVIQIPIDDMVKPIAQPYRRIPIPLEAKVEEKITELLDKDIIEKVQGPSDWISPIVPIIKDNGDIRICVDMRRANKAIKRENHPLPTMDQLLPKFRNAKIFSKLDIQDAFHQLELHPDSRGITTFISGKGVYRYKRLMFGITCAPEIFQKTIERILVGCEGVVNFIDDILVFGENQNEHDARLKKVLEVLEEYDVVLKKEKCIYSVNKVQFLGHELTRDGIRPLDKYVSAIMDFRAPRTISELQSFLGLVNYVGKWIPNMATTTEPLKELLRLKKGRNTDICELWQESQERAFDQLKAALSEIPNLGYYNVQDKTLVFADASPVGLGAVLVQINHAGPRIIAYGNKTLTDCERRYCQTEKEALSLVWAVEHFHMFLFGKRFQLITDHKPLEVIFGPKAKPCARIERWILRLQSYDYQVVYRPGKNNIADPLSRLCKNLDGRNDMKGKDYVQNIIEHIRPVAISLHEIEMVSKNDPEIQKVKKGLYDAKWEEEVKSFRILENELCFSGDILLRGNKIVIPKQLQGKVLEAAHEGHPGIVGMKARLRTKVWWPRYDKDVEKVVKSCKGCTLVSAPNPPNPIKRRELPTHPWIDTALDLLGPLPSGDYLLVVIDYYSRYKEIKACRDISSKAIIAILREMFSRLGCPITITADNGKQFVSQEFKDFCRSNDIHLFNTIPYWPQQNGEVERQNRDIVKRLKISQIEKKNWKESLLDYLTMYNSTPHSTTGKTPAELFFQRKFRDKIPMIDALEYSHKDQDMDVRDRDKQQKAKGKEYTDKKRNAREGDLKAGDQVYMKNMNKTNKLAPNFEPTPHTVISCKDGDVHIKNNESGQQMRRNIMHLKKVEGQWKVMDEEEETTICNESELQ